MKRPTCLVLRGLRAENLADGHFLEEGLRGEATLLERKLAEMALLIGLLEDVLLHGALAHQPVDVHVARLPDAVRAVLRLRVHRRVPVRVVENHRVGAHQIDAQTARPRAEDEDEHLSVVVELLHHLLALGERRGAVHSQIREVVHVQKRLEDVQHPRHLRKQQTAMAFLTQTRKHIAQHLQLPAVELDQTLLRKLHAVKRHPRVDRRPISHIPAGILQRAVHATKRLGGLAQLGVPVLQSASHRADWVTRTRASHQNRIVLHVLPLTLTNRGEIGNQGAQRVREVVPPAGIGLDVGGGATVDRNEGAKIGAPERNALKSPLVVKSEANGANSLTKERFLHGLLLNPANRGNRGTGPDF